MALYSFKGDYPQPLPERIRLSSGLTRTDSSTFTEEEIADAGYVPVSDEPVVGMLQTVVWRQGGWDIIDLTPQEIENLKVSQWQSIREKRNRVLQDTDWIIVKAFETKQEIPKEILEYRQALRDITTQEDPFNIIWPQAPSMNGTQQLSAGSPQQ